MPAPLALLLEFWDTDAMQEEIRGHFESNLERVGNLIAIYEEMTPAGRGRRPVASGDLLRAAVVLLHASLEDLVRSVVQWRLPLAPAEALSNLPLADTDSPKRTKFTIPELARHRGKTVDMVIEESVDFFLERASFNDPGEVSRILGLLGLDTGILDGYSRWIGPMMRRRHWIVHQVDRNRSAGRGHHVIQSLSKKEVEGWRQKVEALGNDILDAFI